MPIPNEDNPEVAKFEKEAERTRAELSQTVGDLREKIGETVSPAAVKREVKEYVQQSGEQLIETIRRKAYENPLQAIAVAAGLGYPLWRMFSNVPVPVLMVGAGIALARPGMKSADHARLASSPYGDAALYPTRADKTSATAKAAGVMADAADQVASSAKGITDSLQTSVGEAAASTVQTAQASADEVSNAVDRYPLFVGAIGLGLGALIGAAIPRTSAESELVGEMSEEVQDRAGQMMKSGLDAVKEAASRVYDQATDEADKQGLTGQPVRESTRDLNDQLLGNRSEQTAGRSRKNDNKSGEHT